MNKNAIPLLLACAALVGLGGCETAKSVVGMQKQAPDEFEVVTRAPLSIPPDYGLRPPAPGAERPQDVAPRDEARRILLRNSGNQVQTQADEAVRSGRFSRGEAALLARAGAVDADPSIRQKVNQESTALADESDTITQKLLFWQDPPAPGQVVNAEQESRRIREARAMGDPVNKGDVPVIERKEKGWLEGIF